MIWDTTKCWQPQRKPVTPVCSASKTSVPTAGRNKDGMRTKTTHFVSLYIPIRIGYIRDIPGSPVVKTPHFSAGSMGSIPCQITKILHATRCGQKVQVFVCFFFFNWLVGGIQWNRKFLFFLNIFLM